MLDQEAPTGDPDDVSTLSEIMGLVDVEVGTISDGWTGQTARLFALDTAIMAIRRNLLALTEVDRQNLAFQLHEARTLVMNGRDSELGSIQAALESQLTLVEPGRRRRIWLTAIDALLPSPFRAALVSTRNALSMGTSETLTTLADLLRERLLVRLGDGSLLPEPQNPLHLTA